MKIFFDGKPASQDKRIFRGPDVIDTLGPDAHLTYGTATAMGDSLGFKVTLEWEDESGSDRWESVLT